MAAASMKNIKIRIKSVESTMQITKAMELVASSKLRKAKERVERSRPYFNILHNTLCDIKENNREFTSEFVIKRSVKRVCYLVIAGDRGLAGGYNNNLFKLVEGSIGNMPRESVTILPIGKKAVEHYEKRGYEILSTAFSIAEDVSVSDCFEISRLLSKEFLANHFDELYIAYTKFDSMLSQTPDAIKILPLSIERTEERAKDTKPRMMTIYEPSSESVFDCIVPEYIAGMIYGAVSEAWASELGARRTAMDSASKNASEMIESLSLQYNRARQSSITQEITEIVAGSEST